MHVMSAVRSRSRRWVIRGLSRAHLAVHRVTRGGVLGSVAGMPVLLLTTTGRRSGKARTTPLTFFRDGTDLVVIASNGGADRPPDWSLNLQQTPRAVVEIGTDRLVVEAGRRRSRNASGCGPWSRRRTPATPATRNGQRDGYRSSFSDPKPGRANGEPSPYAASRCRRQPEAACLPRRIGRQGRSMDGGAHPGKRPVPARDRPTPVTQEADARAYEAWRHARPSPGRRWLYRPAMTPRVRHAAILATLALVCLTAPGGATPTASAMVGARAAHAGAAATFPQPRLPAAGELVETVAVRAAPRRSAPVVRTLRRFRPDDQFQVVLALARRRGADGEWWYRLSLPGRPNGARGWIPAAVAELRPVVNRIVVRLGARRLEVRRVRDGRCSFAPSWRLAPPAPRRRGAATSTSSRRSSPPIRSSGRSRSRRARTPASRTGRRPSSASTARTCRGFSGRPSRTAASGSSNDVATRLRRLAPLGTPIDIVR